MQQTFPEATRMRVEYLTKSIVEDLPKVVDVGRALAELRGSDACPKYLPYEHFEHYCRMGLRLEPEVVDAIISLADSLAHLSPITRGI